MKRKRFNVINLSICHKSSQFALSLSSICENALHVLALRYVCTYVLDVRENYDDDEVRMFCAYRHKLKYNIERFGFGLIFRLAWMNDGVVLSLLSAVCSCFVYHCKKSFIQQTSTHTHTLNHTLLTPSPWYINLCGHTADGNKNCKSNTTRREQKKARIKRSQVCIMRVKHWATSNYISSKCEGVSEMARR